MNQPVMGSGVKRSRILWLVIHQTSDLNGFVIYHCVKYIYIYTHCFICMSLCYCTISMFYHVYHNLQVLPISMLHPWWRFGFCSMLRTGAPQIRRLRRKNKEVWVVGATIDIPLMENGCFNDVFTMFYPYVWWFHGSLMAHSQSARRSAVLFAIVNVCAVTCFDILWENARFLSMYHVDRGYADEQKRRIPRPKWLILFKFIVFFAMYLHMCSKLSSLAIFFSYLSSRCCHNFPRLVNTCPSLRRCHCLSNPNPNPMDQRAVEKRRCAVALLEALTP